MKKVTILLAVYKPDMNFFEKLLRSLNDQTYANLFLNIRDDSADDSQYVKISKVVNELITNFDFQILKNEHNMGSNKTFEQLTLESNGDYFAYCDQDDIWNKDKLAKLVKKIEEENAEMCYSDLSVINQDDFQIAASFTELKKRVVHVYGDDLFDYFIRRSSVTGCTMMVKATVAKKALPFPTEFMVHDQWLTLYSAAIGKIAYVAEPLIRYRIYEGNQIGAAVLPDINSKAEYLQRRLLKKRDKFLFLRKNDAFNPKQIEQINSNIEFIETRIQFFEQTNFNHSINMFKEMNKDKQLILLEVFIGVMPKIIVKKLFDKLHNNKS